MARKTRMNKVTSPEKTALINKKNLQLKDEFLMYLRSQQCSEGTIKGYNNDLMILMTWMLDEADNKEYRLLTKRDIIRFQNWMLNQGNSSARIRRVKASMSSLSNYCEDILAEEDPDYKDYRSIVRKIKSPPLQPVREKTIWDYKELEDLLEQLVNRERYDLACYLALGMYSGRRKAELCRFKVSDFDDDKLVCDGALYMSDPIKTKGMGGGKYIPCYVLAKKFKPYFDLWMGVRRLANVQSEWLFPSPVDPTEHIPLSTANSYMKTLDRMTGKSMYAHSLRHAFCTLLAESGLPDSAIQEIFGWSSVELVSVYNDLASNVKISKYFKNGEINVPKSRGLDEL